MSEQYTVDHGDAILVWKRYHEIWKSRSILVLCSQFRPKCVTKAIKRGIKNEG